MNSEKLGEKFGVVSSNHRQTTSTVSIPNRSCFDYPSSRPPLAPRLSAEIPELHRVVGSHLEVHSYQKCVIFSSVHCHLPSLHRDSNDFAIRPFLVAEVPRTSPGPPSPDSEWPSFPPRDQKRLSAVVQMSLMHQSLLLSWLLLFPFNAKVMDFCRRSDGSSTPPSTTVTFTVFYSKLKAIHVFTSRRHQLLFFDDPHSLIVAAAICEKFSGMKLFVVFPVFQV